MYRANTILSLLLVLSALSPAFCADSYPMPRWQGGAVPKGFPAGTDFAQYNNYGYPIPATLSEPAFPGSVAFDYKEADGRRILFFVCTAMPTEVTNWYESYYKSNGGKVTAEGARTDNPADKSMRAQRGGKTIDVLAVHYSDMPLTTIEMAVKQQ